MVKRLLSSKIFVLFLCMILVGFAIGYTYSIVTSKSPENNKINTVGDVLEESNKNVENAQSED